MKLLIDQNISHRILSHLPTVFVDSSHVRNEGHLNIDDTSIFMFARQKKFSAIITLDHDFISLLSLHGFPPKIIWLRTGNCSTNYLGELLKRNEQTILSFLANRDVDCLQIFK